MRKVLLTAALAALLALPVLAQRRGGGGFQLDAASLLANKSVQEELKLSEGQKKEIGEAKDARDKAAAKAREDKDREAGQKAGADFSKSMKSVVEKLDDAQRKRLMEIEVQLATRFNSPRVFANPDVQKALKLDTKQKDAIKEAVSDYEKDAKEVRDEAKGDFKKFGAVMKKVGELGKKSFDEIAKTLSDDQRKIWDKLGGEKADIKFEGFGAGGGNFGKDKRKKKDD